MADYYPLIAKAVNGLEKSTGEARRALYDRARTALLARLRGVEPALAEPDITRERLALEEAIRKIEAEAARRSRNDPSPPPRPEPPRPELPLRAARQATIAQPADAVDARPASAPTRPAAALSAAGIEPDSTARDDDFGPSVKPEYPTRPPSSMVRQEDVRARTPVAPRAAKPERKPAAAKRPPRPWKKLMALSIVTLLILAVAAIGILQRQQIIAWFRSTPGFNRTADSGGPADSGARPKIADRIGSAPFTTQSSNDGSLVAQKAVLYEEDQNDPNGRRFVGSAVWHTDRVPAGPGQSPEVAIRADVEIPEQRIALRWSLRRNEDKSLPASHTVEIMFTLPADFPHGGITNIPGVAMKQGESTRGDPLAGLAVKVTTNFFLIGLSSVDADLQRNIQLLKERQWFDIPVVYGDGQRAIIAIEKGTPGERVFGEAFAAWGG